MAVAGKDKRHIETFARCVEFRLFQSVSGWKILRFGFDERNGDWLACGIDRDAQRVISATFRALAWFAVNDFDCARCFLATNEVFCPAAGMQRGINQLCAGIGFAEPHAPCVTEAGVVVVIKSQPANTSDLHAFSRTGLNDFDLRPPAMDLLLE